MESSVGRSDFLVASAGATAALAGLVFVALSINLAKILALEGVTERAGGGNARFSYSKERLNPRLQPGIR
jgi:hypothetical protein